MCGTYFWISERLYGRVGTRTGLPCVPVDGPADLGHGGVVEGRKGQLPAVGRRPDSVVLLQNVFCKKRRERETIINIRLKISKLRLHGKIFGGLFM